MCCIGNGFGDGGVFQDLAGYLTRQWTAVRKVGHEMFVFMCVCVCVWYGMFVVSVCLCVVCASVSDIHMSTCT